MNILKEIKENGTMFDMVQNVIHNIKFYIKHRDELNDINISNQDLCVFVSKLEDVIQLYNENKIPNWFKYHQAYQFTTSNFPYFNGVFPWLLSFRDYVEVLLENGEVIDSDTVKLGNKIYKTEMWRKHYTYMN